MPPEGRLLKRDWFRRYDLEPEKFKRFVIGIDCAAKTGVANDNSVLAVVGMTQSEYYVLNVIAKKVEFPDLVRTLEGRVWAMERGKAGNGSCVL
ncbi:MAG: hypothetical protein JO165_02625 [Candidatus Eremiobacteraeota bacterium]|nr:hypothetical protein [Candidatus Eremiobacteraeota bacterium]